MRRLKICFICRTWCPDAQLVNGTMLCTPCWGDVIYLQDMVPRRAGVAQRRLVQAGGEGEPKVDIGEGPDSPVPPAHDEQLVLQWD